MDSHDIRNLQEAYLEVLMNEGIRILPRGRMSDKSSSKRLKALGIKLKSKFTTAKGTTARNVEDAKAKKLESQADRIDKAAREHIPNAARSKEEKNRGGPYNRRNPMGSDEYAEMQFAKNRAMLKMGDDVDIYDFVLTHLLDEGYVNDLESAENIMENMSEEWLYDILESYDLSEHTLDDMYKLYEASGGVIGGRFFRKKKSSNPGQKKI